MAKRLSDLVEEFLAPAFDEAFDDDELMWEWNIVMHPQGGTVIYISAWAASTILGQVVNNGVIVPPYPQLDAKIAKEIVESVKENLAQARSEALQQTPVPEVPQNGSNPPGVGGLNLP